MNRPKRHKETRGEDCSPRDNNKSDRRAHGLPLNRAKNMQSQSQHQESEQILLEIKANLWRHVEAVGGRLKVTSARLLFQPHPFNFQNGPAEIPLSEIQSVVRVDTFGIIHNGLLVTLKSGAEWQFIVGKPEDLIKTILSAIATTKPGQLEAQAGVWPPARIPRLCTVRRKTLRPNEPRHRTPPVGAALLGPPRESVTFAKHSFVEMKTETKNGDNDDHKTFRTLCRIRTAWPSLGSRRSSPSADVFSGSLRG